MANELPVDLREWVKDGSPLGEGGQAVVYRVYRSGDPSRKIHVAKVLKLWNAKAKSPSERDQRGRFKREVVALGSLASTGCPNVVPLIDMELDPPEGLQPWYVMPFYPAGPMARADSEGNVTYAEPYRGNVDRVLEIVESISTTLAWMHDSEPPYSHRDVHTGNIFFEKQGGVPILGDFGLVHVYGDDAVRTGVREPLGPWRWRPPELHGGSVDKDNPKSDVYLLGGIIYEALSGGEYIDEAQQVDGRFTHEQPEYDLARFTSDPRISHVTRLLSNMLARDAAARLTARQVAEACRKIRAWKPGTSAPVSIPAHALLEEAAAKYRQTGRSYKTEAVVEHLGRRCHEVCNRLALPAQPGGQYRFRFAVEANFGDAAPAQVIQTRYPGSAWAAARVRVRFEPAPPIFLLSYVTLIRTDDNREVIGIVNENSKWLTISESFPDDPSHDDRMRDAALVELERLSREAASRLETARLQEDSEAALSKVRIPGIQCAPETARLVRFLMDVATKHVMPWVEEKAALETLHMTPDVLKKALLEADEALVLVETQVGMGSTGFSRVRIRPDTFVTLAPAILPDLDLEADGLKLLRILGAAGLDVRVSTRQIEQEGGVPIPRASILLEYFVFQRFVEAGGSASAVDTLPWGWITLQARGQRVLEGSDKLLY
jgi:hypothetical protein